MSTSLLASLLTPQGRGGVASIRLVGDATRIIEILARHFHPRGRTSLGVIDEIRFGSWGTDPPEDVVICRSSASRWEIHCHGGISAPDRILTDLASSGVARVSWSQLIAEEAGTLAAEFRQLLAETTTLKTAEYVLKQANGLFEREIESLRADIINDDDILRCQHRLREMLKWSTFARRLTQPARIVIAGRPNVGKSSLINALLGYARSIVFDQPGTTRDVVTAETAFDGWPVTLTDTAGMHETSDRLEQSGIERAREKLQSADCRLILLDRSQPVQDFGRQLLAEFPDALIVAHKVDLPPAWNADQLGPHVDVSSKTGAGIDRLISTIIERLFPHLPPDDQAMPLTERQCRILSQCLAALEDNHREQAVLMISSLGICHVD